MPMEGEWITLDEAAARLELERSGVFRMARRGDFGPVREIGGTERPALLLLSAAHVDAVVARRAS